MVQQRENPGIDGEDIATIYRRRLGDRNRALELWTTRDRRVADIRLAVFVAILALGFWVYRGAGFSPWWLAFPGAGFCALVLCHEPIRRAGGRARRAVKFYASGLARLEGRWAGTGASGLEYLELAHPYAADLDIFGVGSLFELLCTARTRAGEAALAAWLLKPASHDEINERHEAIRELRPRLDLREDLEILGVEVREGVDPSALEDWGTASRAFPGLVVPIVAALLAVLATAALCGWLLYDLGLLPLFAVILVEAAFVRVVAARVRRVLEAVEARTHDLVLLSELLRRLETERFEASLLKRLAGALETEDLPASRQIRKLARLLHLLDYQRNQLFMPLALIWLWTTQIAIRIDAWRSGSGQRIGAWLRAIGDFEALCALASYSAENPADPFPELVTGSACFDAKNLGHPLLRPREFVRNDVVLCAETRVLIVSGSNMSGKSTLLRTVGTAAVLAFAGAPVFAARLKLTPLAVGATLRIQDSLQDGKSRFYAEITRVRQLVDLARGRLPLLFLLDELFHGTNSHDRCVGARSVVQGLIARGAIGLVTTHDLTLAQIADRPGSPIVNVHFADRLVDGKMLFDYRMQPGVVKHSNALALMRAIGLEIEDEPSRDGDS
jgi:hypothetical protein